MGECFLQIIENRINGSKILLITKELFDRSIKFIQFPEVHSIPEEGFLYRSDRGSLVSSLITVRHFTDKELLRQYLLEQHRELSSRDKITFSPYGGFDHRIGWNTHIVMVGKHPMGFTSGPVN